MPAFCCTGEPKRQPGSFKKVHERPWELDVQSAVRSRRPPYQPPLFMIVGLDGEGIAAAAIYEELDGPAVVQVQFMAVALRCRGRGGGTADEMFGEILRRLELGRTLVADDASMGSTYRASAWLFEPA